MSHGRQGAERVPGEPRRGVRLDRRRFLVLGVGAALGAAWYAVRARRGALAPALATPPMPPPAGTNAGTSAATNAATASQTPAVAAAGASCDEALAVAKRHIQTYCCTLDFPNGAIHALRALGRDAPLGAGDPFRLVLEKFVVENWVAGRAFLEVPVEYEGHRNAMLKTLIEAGCEPELEFTVQGRRHRFAECIESARLLASYPGNLDIDEHSWTIMALTRVLPPDQGRWTNVHGQVVDLGVMIDATSAALARDTALIRSVDLGLDDPPRDCPALSRACGGLHMLYAIAVAIANGYGTPERRQALGGHLRTAVRRLTYDEKVTAAVERQNTRTAGAEAALGVAFDARVKLLGHLLETFGVVDRHRLYTFTEAERGEIDAGRARLCALLAGSRELKFERYRNDRALFDSLTTGVCHAYNGLRLSPA